MKKGRWKIENGRWKSSKRRRGPFVLGLTKWEFSTRKKKIRKIDFAPRKNIPLTPVWCGWENATHAL